MKTFIISAMRKGAAPLNGKPADFKDWFKAETEEAARALWEADNQNFCGGNLEIVKVEEETK